MTFSKIRRTLLTSSDLNPEASSVQQDLLVIHAYWKYFLNIAVIQYIMAKVAVTIGRTKIERL